MTPAGATATLDPPPAPVWVGTGTAVLLTGTVDPDLAGGLGVAAGPLALPVDGLHPLPGSRELRWWALVPVPADTAPGSHAVTLRAGDRSVKVGQLELRAGSPKSPERPAINAAPIAICMATHEPQPAAFAAQIESIRGQSRDDWVCLISDDASSPASLAAMRSAIGDDPRFHIAHSDERLGFYDNFERALLMVPAETELVALSDQDDRWHADKLELLAQSLRESPGAQLAYSDMRVVDASGAVISDTFWYASHNAYEDLATLLIVNTVTGAASMFRRRLLDVALPFPPAFSREHYHDHWVALCALATGTITYLDRPTWDYTRHSRSVTMRATSGWDPPPDGRIERARQRARRAGRRLRRAAAAGVWPRAYFERYVLIRQFSAVLELRAATSMTPAKRQALDRVACAEGSPRSVAWLLLRTLRPLVGRDETLGRERVLLSALAWRRLRARRP